MLTFADDAALDAYEALAPAYDVLTDGYDYEGWLEALLDLVAGYGLAGTNVLDAACGTGKSFMPLRARGYAITAFDLSPSMTEQARMKAPEANVFVGDMRTLVEIDHFDLLTCLDDSLNYLLTRDDLVAALSGFRRNLAPCGLAVWDLNTLAMYRTAFSSDWVTSTESTVIAWHGLADDSHAPGAVAAARVDVFAELNASGLWSRSTSEHRQRHWTVDEIGGVVEEAGLEIVAIRGQRRGAVLDAHLDELVHTKAVFVACRDDRPNPRRC